jgi:hypothetical protein
VAGDDVRPASVGGSAPVSDRSVNPSSDTLAADQARIDKIPKWDRSKNAPVGAPPKPQKPSSLKEDINQLPVVDQMRAWRQLMEADKPRIAVLPGETTSQAVARAQAELNAPKPTPAAQSSTTSSKPKLPSLLQRPTPIAGPGRFDSPEEIKARAERARNTGRAPAAVEVPVPAEVPVDTTAPARPRPRSVTGDIPVDPNFGRAPAPPPPNIPPPENVPPESALGKMGKLGKTAARGFDMFYQIYEGYKQIVKLDYNTMPRDQYWVAVYKIVGRLAGDYGLFWVGSFLGGLIAGAFTANPLGAVAGFFAGGTGGIAVSYLLGDSVGTITDAIVDSVYGTSTTPTPAPAPQPNKPTAEEIAEVKAYYEKMTGWIAAGGIPDEQDKKDIDKAKAVLKAAGVTVAATPAPAPAANPVAEIVTELQSIAADVDKIYADQTPLAGENGKTEMAKITALISKHEALTEKMAKLPPDLRAPELINAENAVNKKIYLAQRSVLHRSLLQDTDPAVYPKHKAGADKLMAFEAEVNDLDVKDPDFQKKAVALARQINQMIDSLPAVPDGDRGAYMVRQQSLTAARDVMQRKQKEYEDWKAKNPAPTPATGAPKQGDTRLSKSGKKMIYNNGAWEYAN